MSWYNSDWKRRAAILIDNHAGATPIDVTATIPTDWPAFWDTVLTTGNDIRVTAADGITLLPFDTDAFNATTKVGVIEIDNYAVPSTAAGVQAYVYWDHDTAPNGRTPFVPSSPKEGYIEIGKPGSGSEPVIVAAPVQAGSDTPAAVIPKTPAEEIQVWFNLLPAMQKRRTPNQKSFLFEGVDTVTYQVLNSSSVAQAGMIDTATVRTMHPGWVRVLVKAGADNTNYVLELSVGTTGLRTLRFYATIKVRTITPPA